MDDHRHSGEEIEEIFDSREDIGGGVIQSRYGQEDRPEIQVS